MPACCREAQLEKKAASREAAKEREQSPDISKLPGGGDIMGGDDSFAAAKARYHMFETSVSFLRKPPSPNRLGRAKVLHRYKLFSTLVVFCVCGLVVRGG